MLMEDINGEEAILYQVGHSVFEGHAQSGAKRNKTLILLTFCERNKIKILLRLRQRYAIIEAYKAECRFSGPGACLEVLL